MKRFVIILALCLFFQYGMAQAGEQYRWTILPGKEICWKAGEGELPHYDHIEMSGRKVSVVLRYGVREDGSFYLNRGMVWPLLRTVPNNTHASLMRKFGEDVISKILVNGRALEKEKVKEIRLNGLMTVTSEFPAGVSLERELFPSVALPVFCEYYTIGNTGTKNLKIELPVSESVIQTRKEEGVSGSYRLVLKQDGGSYIVKPGEKVGFGVTIAGYKPGEDTDGEINVGKEKEARCELIRQFSRNLVLETPDETINTMFKFAKIRGAESIYETKGGMMHGPGGESFYAAIWANDQAEYINPFFPFLGYAVGNESALNSYRHFARFMNPEYKKLPSSVIAEGEDTWGGAGDRGDAAMIAYGAARYALASGNKGEAQELWALIEWCLEYCRRQLNPEGVVASDSDELEGRFPAGKANLCTSSLYYDALISAHYLAKELGKPSRRYEEQAKQLRKSLDAYFAADVEGYDTYRYYAGNDVLRSWICIPLTVGITERKEGTVAALFSPRLWTKEGLLTQAGSETYWDRSTLYALRGVLAVGETEKAINYLKYYSGHRLLGEHVPYAIEAWPEGNQRHLSAESGLYCRIFTEGLFGIRPAGFGSFTLTPRLPEEWDNMALRHIRAFDADMDIEVMRKGKNIQVVIYNAGKLLVSKTIRANGSVEVSL